ncbi:unnamed protein product [Heterobilharzia americana]|nr:unnamed protein product [Heterobilharzia americana]
MNILCFCCRSYHSKLGSISKVTAKNGSTEAYFRGVNSELDPKHFIIVDKNSGIFGRIPGEINGQQFVIQNCKNSYIYLLDHSIAITVDDCSSCTIVTGPVKTSFFIRDCRQCTVVTACQQFRSRDCHEIVVFLACTTEPIIESCTDFTFGPYQCSYPGLEDHFTSAGLNIFNCNWSDVYDFTPDENTDSVHISLFEKYDQIEKYILTPQTALEHELESNKLKDAEDSIALLQPLMSLPLSFSSDHSVVPLTIGNKSLFTSLVQVNNPQMGNQPSESALITVFPHEEAIHSAKIICDYLRTAGFCAIVRTRCSQFSEHEIEQIFKCKSNSKMCKSGDVITIEVVGLSNTLKTICEEVLLKTNLPESSKSSIQVITDQLETTQRINLLSGLYKMHMNA